MWWKSILAPLLLTAVFIQGGVRASESPLLSCQDGTSALPFEETPIMLAAAQPLSGNVLEQACQTHAQRALRDSQEWERLGCSKKLQTTSQLFSLDFNDHLLRCKRTVGTAIKDDQDGREALLAKCRGAASQPPQPPRYTPPSTPPPPPPRPPVPTPPPSQPDQEGNKLGEVWAIDLVDLKTLREYHYTYTFTFKGNQFVGKYLTPGNNPSMFQGFISSDGSRIQYTQIYGDYRGNYAGRKKGYNRFEGAVCDSQGNIFLFTLDKK